MNYPLISEYIEAIKSAEDNFQELTNLRPVLGDDGHPVMTSGNFAVVFKMENIETGNIHALKCFTKEQEGRGEAYHQITKELNKAFSPYFISIRYIDRELFVDTDQTTETEFPVLLMDWVEGKTLDNYLRDNINDKYALQMLAYRFNQLANWIIPQPFAHGDLKPDNIIVKRNGDLVLVDYDGMYVPEMYGQKAREIGSPNFRHPLRTINDFDEHIDDFPLVSILLSLLAISLDTQLWAKYGAVDRLLFSEDDYCNIDSNPILNQLFSYNNSEVNIIASVFVSLLKRRFHFTIPLIKKPHKTQKFRNEWIDDLFLLNKQKEGDIAQTPPKPIDAVLDGLIDLDDFFTANGLDYILTGSLGLYMHGLTPYTYIPHDIDVIVLNNALPFMPDDYLLSLFEQYCGCKGPFYEDGTRTYVFYIGNDNIEVNAFCHGKALFAPGNYRKMLIGNHTIKVRDALCIFKEKYRLHRLKDYQFNLDVQNIMNGFLSHEESLNESSEKNLFNMESLIDSGKMSMDYYENKENDDLPF